MPAASGWSFKNWTSDRSVLPVLTVGFQIVTWTRPSFGGTVTETIRVDKTGASALTFTLPTCPALLTAQGLDTLWYSKHADLFEQMLAEYGKSRFDP